MNMMSWGYMKAAPNLRHTWGNTIMVTDILHFSSVD